MKKSEIIRSRVRLSIAAYQYEHNLTPILTDAEFDELAVHVNKYKKRKTGKAAIDKFFAEQFDPCTGVWVHNHPELDKLRLKALELNVANRLES